MLGQNTPSRRVTENINLKKLRPLEEDLEDFKHSINLIKSPIGGLAGMNWNFFGYCE